MEGAFYESHTDTNAFGIELEISEERTKLMTNTRGIGTDIIK